MDELQIRVEAQPRRARWIDDREVSLLVNGRDLLELTGGGDLGGLTPAELPPSDHLHGRPNERMMLDGGSALLICPECGDLGCGAVLARIEVSEAVVTWTDVIYANATDRNAIGREFVFDRAAYERELAAAVRRTGRRPWRAC